MGKLNYQDAKEARIERYKELSEKASAESQQAYKASNDAVAGIPAGQPILVGHHSERTHRNAIKKSWDKMGKSVELDNKSQYYAEKAEAAERNTAISSDDPNALEKLNAKLVRLTNSQEKMKAINRICRSKKLSEEEIREKLRTDFDLKDNKIDILLNPTYYYERKGFQGFSLTNNNARINQVKKRIARLEAQSKLESRDYHYGEVKVSLNVEDNRVEIHFPEKPDKPFRQKLASCGFRWSREKQAWQMKISRWNLREAIAMAKAYQGQ